MPKSHLSLREEINMVKSRSKVGEQDAGSAAIVPVLLIVVILLLSEGILTIAFAGPRDNIPRATSDIGVPVDGVPALTVPLMNNARSFVEWALDLQFTPMQAEYFNRLLSESWKLNDREEIASTILAGQVNLLLPYLGEAERRQLQLRVREDILADLYAEQARPENRWLLEIYTRHYPAARPPIDHTQDLNTALEGYLKSQNHYNSINSMMNNMFR